MYRHYRMNTEKPNDASQGDKTKPNDALQGDQGGMTPQQTSTVDTVAKRVTVVNVKSDAAKIGEKQQRDFEEMENCAKYKYENDIIQQKLKSVEEELAKTKGLLKLKEDEINKLKSQKAQFITQVSSDEDLKNAKSRLNKTQIRPSINKQYDTVAASNIEKYKRELKDKTEECMTLKRENERLEKELSKKNVQRDKLSLEHEKTILDFKRKSGKDIDQILSDENQRLKDELKRLQIEVNEQKMEIDQWKLRLSKVAGERMVDGNSAITDLSDRYRRQKLSEMFISLYDDSWTDAYEVVKDDVKDDDERICKQLLQIFQNCWDYCLKYSKNHLEDLQLSFINTEVNDEIKKREILDNYPSQLTKLIKDTRRCFAQEFLPSLQKKYWKQNEANLALQPYVYTCLEICWRSAICDPALHYVFTADNLEDFRPFTQGGSAVDYVVWPAQRLHEFGPLLLKGVVQFKKPEENSQ